MSTHTLKKIPKNTAEITVTLPWEEVRAEAEKAFESLHANFELQGYRKGKVPADIARQKIKSDAIYSQMLKTLLARIYEDIVKKEGLQPIISPKVELISAKEKEDWQLKYTVALKPAVDVHGYKEVVARVKSEAKKDDIWVPGKEKALSEEDKAKEGEKLLNSILDALLKESKIEIPGLVVEEELNRRLAQLVDDIQRIGLTTDAYLKSKNTTMDELKARFSREIEDTYKLEFMLAEIADQAGIKVEQTDLDRLFSAVKDQKEKQAAEANSYMYASILRKQKTLDYLVGL